MMPPSESRISNSNNNNTTESAPAKKQSRQLSFISRKYDSGNKGYLTSAEQQVRELDQDGLGRISNEQIVGMMEQTMSLKQANKTLRLWVIALLGAVVILGLGNIAVAFTAARLAKDTEVNSSTGELKVKGADKAVVTVSEGKVHTTTISTDENGDPVVCLKTHEVADLWSSSSHGTTTNLVVANYDPQEEEGEDSAEQEEQQVARWLQMHKLEASLANETHVCFGSEQAGQKCEVCVDFTTPCVGGKRHLVRQEKLEIMPHNHRLQSKLFFEMIRRPLPPEHDGSQHNRRLVADVGTGGGLGVDSGRYPLKDNLGSR